MLNPSTKRHLRLAAAPLLLTALLGACGSSDDDHAAAEIRILGNRADLVSGGDALTEIVLSPDANRESLQVSVNGKDVSSEFAPREDGRLVGLVTGLEAGANTIEARTSGARTARLDVTNTPRGGPIYSGPQAGPFFCATVTSRPETATTPETVASGFGTEAVDATCNIATEYRYYYKTTSASCSLNVPDPTPGATPAPNLCFQPFDPAAPAPADLAMTTTDTGLTVPYVVRVERGTTNRGIYDIAVLVDPTQPWTSGAEPQATWNGKVNFLFGGSGGQIYKQMLPASRWTEDMTLSRGWLVAVNTMLDSSRNNNRVVTAETTMMMKEHIVDRYGEIRYTVATGCSAGSINAYSIASQDPNLLDGALISCSLLDYDTSHIINYECGVLTEAYNSPAWKAEMVNAGYTQEQINLKRASVERHKDHTVCQSWYNSFGQQRWNGNNTEVSRIPPANADTGEIVVSPISPPTNNCSLPPALVWDPVTNPTGVRCGPWDWGSSVYGKSPDGVGNSTRDTVGIQYGLLALREGAITPEEFVVLNESIGGLSPVGELTATRTTASLEALETVYRSGLIIGPGLDSLAIISMQGDDNLHPYWRSWGVRERLDKENGHHGNQVIWQFVGSSSPSEAMRLEALLEMDKWLTAVKADASDLPRAQKVVAAKPATTFDYCLLAAKDPTLEPKVTDMAACRADPDLQILGSPRQGAGGPLAENIMKCQLKPIDSADYAPAVLTAGQLARLAVVFPDGVCDWSKPGVGQQPKGDVPFTFVNGPGGEPLPPAPVSQAAE